MPELPEVECIRRSLAARVRALRIASARLLRRDICASVDRAGRAKRTTPRDLLAGAVVSHVLRRGKNLALVADDGRVLAVHLGMSGQFFFLPPGRRPTRPDHIHAAWALADAASGAAAARVIFRDPRRFGGLWTFPDRAGLDARWASLGPDALTITGPALHAALGESSRPLKSALLDQAVIAGVGNIYADEALFAARIAPRRPARAVSESDADRLAAAIRNTLSRAVESGGSTLRDYVDASGNPGSFQLQHAVYGRGALPCPSCGRVLVSDQVAQRTTVWCERCQR